MRGQIYLVRHKRAFSEHGFIPFPSLPSLFQGPCLERWRVVSSNEKTFLKCLRTEFSTHQLFTFVSDTFCQNLNLTFYHHFQRRIDFNTVNPSLPDPLPVERLMRRECLYSTKLKRYWEIHPLCPQDFPRSFRSQGMKHGYIPSSLPGKYCF